jgi:hypothetical protein
MGDFLISILTKYIAELFCGFSRKTALVSGVYSPITKEY